MSDLIIQSEQLVKTYHDGQHTLSVLQGIDMKVNRGDRMAIMGPSGSGKSSLLQLLGGLDKPTSGQVKVLGQSWQDLSECQRCQVRNQTLGFVYQFHHLLPEFSALENVAMPLLLQRLPKKEAISRAQTILDDVGLSARLDHRPSQLSGGERQRVAIARALVHHPACVFADEPTGNLDQATAMKVFDLMLTLNERYDTALVIVTHDQRLASRMEKVFTLEAGVLLCPAEGFMATSHG